MSTRSFTPDTPNWINNIRLPRWLLPADWPEALNPYTQQQEPALAAVQIEQQRFAQVLPANQMSPTPEQSTAWDAQGRLALPGFVDSHTHLDKAFTIHRVGKVKPGLMGAIEASYADCLLWTPEDLHKRGQRSLEWAAAQGTTHLRTHINWTYLEQEPEAWSVTAQLAQAWQAQMRVERVVLAPLENFTEWDHALRFAEQIAQSGSNALLGGFVRSAVWDPKALWNLLAAAKQFDLDVDLHADEELAPEACGLLHTARYAAEMDFKGRIVCGHVCALSIQSDEVVEATINAVKAAPITIVSLPITNLFLQDAVTGRTPRMRGLTLVKELQATGIPVLIANDNVQDPFCPVGNYDLQECMRIATVTAQLDQVFDQTSQWICRTDFLARSIKTPSLVGQKADLQFLVGKKATGWPARSDFAYFLRAGRLQVAPPLPTEDL